MGAQVSEEVTAWASVSDIALIVPKMRFIPTLPVECQIEVVRKLWQNLRWTPSGEVLVMTRNFVDRLFVVVAGEVEVQLANHSHIWLMPPGTFFCEAALVDWRGLAAAGLRSFASPAWSLRGLRRLPRLAVSAIEDFLKQPLHGPRFQGRVRTARRSLITTLTRQELLAAAEARGAGEAARALDGLPVACDVLRNLKGFAGPARDLGERDIASLRVVCEGPLLSTCAGPGLRAGLFGGCLRGRPAAEV
mmetsp:Transcript_109806/g.321535  ORF Transcript_109806/g.321535 Transcript_109806/m.321535 type:complete len:248 (-) Transcript_109806:86-829(-)